MKKFCPFKTITRTEQYYGGRSYSETQFGYCEEDSCMMYKFCKNNEPDSKESEDGKKQFVPWEAN